MVLVVDLEGTGKFAYLIIGSVHFFCCFFFFFRGVGLASILQELGLRKWSKTQGVLRTKDLHHPEDRRGKEGLRYLTVNHSRIFWVSTATRQGTISFFFFKGPTISETN